MNRSTILIAGLLAAAVTPSVASAQLSPTERLRAEQLARIQAKADAAERGRERRVRRQMAEASCRSSMRVWDYANETCMPRLGERARTPR